MGMYFGNVGRLGTVRNIHQTVTSSSFREAFFHPATFGRSLTPSEEMIAFADLTSTEFNNLEQEERQRALYARFDNVNEEIITIGEIDVIRAYLVAQFALVCPHTLTEIAPLGYFKEFKTEPIIVGNRSVIEAVTAEGKTVFLSTQDLSIIMELPKGFELGEIITLGNHEFLTANDRNNRIALPGREGRTLTIYIDPNTLKIVIPPVRAVRVITPALDNIEVTHGDRSQEIINITSLEQNTENGYVGDLVMHEDGTYEIVLPADYEEYAEENGYPHLSSDEDAYTNETVSMVY